MAFLGVLIGFLISLIISALIIYLAAKLFGEKEGFGTAILAALIGGIAWLIALGSLYKMGWLKSFVVAIVIWIFATIVSLVLPTVAGPL